MTLRCNGLKLHRVNTNQHYDVVGTMTALFNLAPRL